MDIYQTSTAKSFTIYFIVGQIFYSSFSVSAILGKLSLDFLGFPLKNITLFHSPFPLNLQKNRKLFNHTEFKWQNGKQARNCRFIPNRSLLYLVNVWKMIVWIKKKLRKMITKHSIRYTLLILYSLQPSLFWLGVIGSAVQRKIVLKT